MKTEYKHIHFVRTQPARPRLTKMFNCKNTKGDYRLGRIQWKPSWRQYCFLPDRHMVFSKSCLEDINDFIKQLMDERKTS